MNSASERLPIFRLNCENRNEYAISENGVIIWETVRLFRHHISDSFSFINKTSLSTVF
jgi:hypothetical protein